MHQGSVCNEAIRLGYKALGINIECKGGNNEPVFIILNENEIVPEKLICALKISSITKENSNPIGYWKFPPKLEKRDPCVNF